MYQFNELFIENIDVWTKAELKTFTKRGRKKLDNKPHNFV